MAKPTAYKLVPRHSGPRIQADTIKIERQPDNKLKVTWCEARISLCIAWHTLLEGDGLELDTTLSNDL